MDNDGYKIATIRLSGKKGAAAFLILLAVILGCVLNVWGMTSDDSKMFEALKSALMTDHIRSFGDDIKKYVDAGEIKKAAELGARISGAKVDIQSLQIAYPAIQYFTGKSDVVAKVTYRIVIKDVPGEIRTEYYEMHKSHLADSWFCAGKVPMFYYYINMIDDAD